MQGSVVRYLMSKLSIKRAAAEFDILTEEERRALRVSRFHALPAVATSSSHESRPRCYNRVQVLVHAAELLATIRVYERVAWTS